MKWHRIWAVVLRYLIKLPQDFNEWSSMFFWPVLDIALFGFVGVWLHGNASHTETATLLAGVTLWQLVVRANFDIALSLLEEVWTHNTVNLFATPLHIMEWASAVITRGFVLGIFTTGVNALFVWATYGYNLFAIGPFLLYTWTQLFISGVGLGLIGAALLLRWGPQVQTLIYMLGFIAAPISGAFYPVYVLPSWLQTVAYTLPLTYTFEGLYQYLEDGTWSSSAMLHTTILNGILITAALIIFHRCYNISKQYGLARLAE